jgi:hypothetical protein
MRIDNWYAPLDNPATKPLDGASACAKNKRWSGNWKLKKVEPSRLFNGGQLKGSGVSVPRIVSFCGTAEQWTFDWKISFFSTVSF